MPSILKTLALLLPIAWNGAMAAAPEAPPAPAVKPVAPMPPSADRELRDAMAIIEQKFLKNLTHEQIVGLALKALLSDLDPYSKYLTPAERGLFESDLSGAFGGVGVSFFFDTPTKQPTIERLMVESPGARAGLRVGDVLVAIDGQPTTGIDADTVLGRVRGKPDTWVELRIQRGQAPAFDVRVARELVHQPSARGVRRDAAGKPDYWLDAAKGIGYVRINRFADDTAPTLKLALAELSRQPLNGLVLDLRDCVGGSMHAALDAADLFVDEGLLLSIVQRDKGDRYEASPGLYTTLPLAVLINEGTVSSGEIFVAALKDNHRAVLVGQRTYGKGRIQKLIALGEGRGAVVLSTGTFQRPSGKTIDRNDVPKGSPDAGIAPDPGQEVIVDEKEHGVWLTQAELLDSAVLLSEEEQRPPAPDRVLERALQALSEGAKP